MRRRDREPIPRRTKNQLYRSQGGRCAYCGGSHRIDYLEIDHKHPVSRDGGDEIENLQLLCTLCNMRKGIQTDQEFRRRYQRLLPQDGRIPSPPIPQADFNEETQYTRAPREVRRIYHRRFEAARQRQRSNSGCGILVAIVALIPIALALLVVT
ncbi:MAG: HNH endonuclease signature motif containing protein [Chloroflexota bacterium]|nr:HNH endonuclease signature motif containing protein [Chloroflexota bacterium]MDE2883879.1 HNH endonuclease signature motif containing protein [Chloroflexota bacterium]